MRATIQEAMLGVISVLLHVVNLNTDLVSGPVMVGIRPSLPVEGVSLILGDDLCSWGESYSKSCVSLNPQLSTVPEEVELHMAEVFPSCVITRATGRKMKGNELYIRWLSLVNVVERCWS